MRNTSTWIVVFATAFAGCLDADPLPNLPDAGSGRGGGGGSGGGTMMPDASPDDDSPVSDVDPIELCRSCVRAACSADYAACDAFPKCVATVECSYSDGCFARTLFEFNNCGISCAGKSGIGSTSDPAVMPLTNLASCGWAACGVSACGGTP